MEAKNKNAVRCQIHPLETVNNFCKRSICALISGECMVGLCATCVADHTKMHHMAQTYPDYENIQQTYQITSAILNEEALKLQKQKVKFESIKSQIQTKKTQVKNLLVKAKKDSLAFVERYYNELISVYMERIEKQQKKTGYHLKPEIQKLTIQLAKQEDQMRKLIYDLNRFKSPGLIKDLHLNIVPRNQKNYEKISKTMEQNSTFTPQLIYKPAFLAEFKVTIDKLVSLDFIYPNDCQEKKGNLRSSCVNFHSILKPDDKPCAVRPKSCSKYGKIEVTLSNKGQGKENSSTMSRVSRRSNIFNATINNNVRH